MDHKIFSAPQILDFKKAGDRRKILALRRKKTISIVDEYKEQKWELLCIKDPGVMGTAKKDSIMVSPKEGKWVYLPWKPALVHVLDKADFERLRTSRNQYLILPGEHKRFMKGRIGVAGLNVGNPAAICLALEGGGNDMKLADFDELSVSNLNRFRAGIAELGENKVYISAHQIYETNPYAKLTLYDRGITRENIDEFLNKPKIDVLVEEMDALPLKILIRERARHFRIPVVMVTGNGHDVILDVERYDLDPKLPILNGYLKKQLIAEIANGAAKGFPFEKKVQLARDFMGKRYLHPRLVASFSLVGKQLAGIPQLAESSFLRGATVAYAVRQIVTGKPMKSGRHNVRLSGLGTKGNAY